MVATSELEVQRRSVLVRGTGAILVTLAAVLGGRSAHAKMSQADAAYQTTPRGSQSCATCAHCLGGGACRVVQGTVVPQGWCKLFAKA